MKKLLLLFALLFLISNLLSQNNNTISSYNNYFSLSREIPYLHLNKTSFLQGEEIWFQAYVLDLNTQKLHKNTTNLYCTIFDNKGKQKDTKLFYVKNGVASGSFKVDSTYTADSYYIKSHTNFMKNFKEDLSFLQEIKIINDSKKNTLESNQEIEYDFRLLPEGGHILSETENTIGVIFKNSQNKGIEITGKVLDENNQEVTTFSTNQFGLGKFSFFIEKDKSYKIQATLENGQKLSQNLPLPQDFGVNISVKNPYTNTISFIIKTNKNSAKKLNGKKYYFLIHNTNSYLKREIVFKNEATNFNFIINNNKFKAGTNIITLFNDKNKPIAERIFFIYKKTLLENLDLVKYGNKNDSISLNIFKKNKDTSNYFISASFLPHSTKAYKPKNSILSKFLLSPFISGDIENPNYYFTKINRKKLIKLDLLLLTQGWSKYNWYNIFNNPPKKHHQFDKGITVKGTLNSPLKDSLDVYLFSPKNNLILQEKLANNKFYFNNLFLKEGSNINFSTLYKKQLKKLKAYIRFKPTPHLNETIKIDTTTLILNKKKETDFKNFILNSENILDEVEVKAKLKYSNNPNIFGNFDSYKVSQLKNKQQRLLDFFRLKGFSVTEHNFHIHIRNRRSTGSVNGIVRPKIFLDGIQIYSALTNNLDFIEFTFVDDYDEIFISDSFNGEIHLYSKKEFSKKKKENFFQSYKVPIGFSENKEYYSPKYASTSDKGFKNYGALFWQPNIIIDKDKVRKSIRIPKLNQKEFKVYIEGITSDGKLISTEKIITLE